MQHLMKELMGKRGLSLQTKFVNYVTDGMGPEVQWVIEPYRVHLSATLTLIEPTPKDTVETIEQQIADRGGILSYQQEHMRRRQAEKAADRQRMQRQ